MHFSHVFQWVDQVLHRDLGDSKYRFGLRLEAVSLEPTLSTNTLLSDAYCLRSCAAIGELRGSVFAIRLVVVWPVL